MSPSSNNHHQDYLSILGSTIYGMFNTKSWAYNSSHKNAPSHTQNPTCAGFLSKSIFICLSFPIFDLEGNIVVEVVKILGLGWRTFRFGC